MNSIHTLRAVLLAPFFAAAMLRPAAAGPQDFVLVNHTGATIYVVNVSSSKTDRWEEDILGAQTLADGEAVTVRFHAGDERCWDLRVRFADGSGLSLRELDLWTVRRITLHEDASASLRVDAHKEPAPAPRETAYSI